MKYPKYKTMHIASVVIPFGISFSVDILPNFQGILKKIWPFGGHFGFFRPPGRQAE